MIFLVSRPFQSHVARNIFTPLKNHEKYYSRFDGGMLVSLMFSLRSLHRPLARGDGQNKVKKARNKNNTVLLISQSIYEMYYCLRTFQKPCISIKEFVIYCKCMSWLKSNSLCIEHSAQCNSLLYLALL